MRKPLRMIRAICIAFSMFTKIPVPQFKWEEEDMKYMLLFFPFAGIMIGGAVYGWGMICGYYTLNKVCFVMIGTALPLLLSGGIHMDGYMDTMDALHSFRDREEKLRILKDPHIGAFSVIRVITYYLVHIGALSLLEGHRALLLLAFGFFLSRILSAVGMIYFPKAKSDGLSVQFSERADKIKGGFFLFLQFLFCAAAMLKVSFYAGGILLCISLLALWYYRSKSIKEFGGITGDLSGYFTTRCEGVLLVSLAVLQTCGIV